MSDQDYREIHLSGKQLVFLFMASLVLAVAIFLLGVSVGRGVREATVMAGPAMTDEALPPAVTEERVPPAEIPPPTDITAADRAYHDKLQGDTTPPPSAPPPSRVDTAPEPPTPPQESGPPPVSTPPPAAAKPAVPPPATPAARPAPTAAKPVPPSSGRGWVAQVGAFGSRPNADRLVAQLKEKGFSAYAELSGSLNRVVVGPFKDRAEAETAAARLRTEGFKPLITR